MTIMVGVGAINTGNNLLYLLLGMMLGLIIVSGILSERVLKKVTVRRLEVGDLFANRVNRIPFEIDNKKRFMSSYSLTVQEHESRETRAFRRVAAGMTPSPPTRRKDREAEGDPRGPKGLAIRVPPGANAIATAEYVFPRRGLYRYVGFDLATKFPFGFFEKVKPFRETREFLVYPEIRGDVGHLVADDFREGEVARQSEGRMGEFFGLREYREGDDLRDVHWKVTARRGKLVRRLYDRRDNESIAIHLYNWVPSGGVEGNETTWLREMEDAIVIAASACAELVKRGHRFSLHTIDETVSEGAGAGQLQSVLRALALLEIRRDTAPPGLQVSTAENRLLVVSTTLPPEIEARFESKLTAPARSAA
ncbi:MAG: hypothetical protein ACJAYU_000852 [Bradymonadia bacterium]|jgi:uncharacterized protein (DUF58 family)